MADIVTDRIAKWFAEHNDGEFARPARTHPYTVIVPAPSTRTVLYTTKPQCVLYPLARCDTTLPIAMVGRYGLPNEEDVAWLRGLAGDRVVCFLGDADPADLLVFTWLRSQMAVTYAGVNDSLMSKIGVRWTDGVSVPLADSESAALPLLAELCPNFRALLGAQCAGLLDRGRKLEVEGVTSLSNVGGQTFVNALTP